MTILSAGCATSTVTQRQDTVDTTQISQQTPPQTRRPVADRCASMGASSGISIEGQLGTLTRVEVSSTLNPVLERLQTCYTQRLEEHPYLAGEVQFKLRIATDGSVRWVIPTRSSMGDRVTEQCMMGALRALRFPTPCGGEAETTWGPSFEGGEDARPATAWDSGRIQRQIDRRRVQLTQCLQRAPGARADITLYVAPTGRVAAAGAAVSTPEAGESIDCIVQELLTWQQLPSPGSYAAKTTFSIP